MNLCQYYSLFCACLSISNWKQCFAKFVDSLNGLKSSSKLFWQCTLLDMALLANITFLTSYCTETWHGYEFSSLSSSSYDHTRVFPTEAVGFLAYSKWEQWKR